MDSLIYVLQSIVLFPIAYFFVGFLVKKISFKFLEKREHRLGCIDGLRGYLAIFVFITHGQLTWHYNITGDWGGNPLIKSNFGFIGVSLFFMITGYLFISKIVVRKGKVDWLYLFESRIFRIYPLYIFVLFLVSVIVFSSDPNINSSFGSLFYDYFKWLVFYGGNINEYKNTTVIVAGVIWTLKYEWMFYLALPLIAKVIFKFKTLGVLALLVLSLVGYFFPFTIITAISSEYLILFFIGGGVVYLNTTNIINKIDFDSFSCSAFTLLFFLFSVLTSKSYPTLSLISLVLVFITICNGTSIFGLLSTKSSILLGEISYSIYLIHGVILYTFFTIFNIIDLGEYGFIAFNLILLPLMTMLVIIISSLTFLYIEKPGIDLGKKRYLVSSLIMLKNITSLHKNYLRSK
ncbi:acyltransferase family protein [Vibrio sp. 10N.261.51.A4]|uniref:acyltransferase family protein n=1 Tax=Vibrio sp. 10N.261.51.A4 TaxID=3229674 RepID=UPI00354C9C22